MKTSGIILSALGVGLLATGIIYLIKKKKEENKSSLTGINNPLSKEAQKCPKGYFLQKGVCILIPETSTHTKSLYE